MRISDWSSDVCSSDLAGRAGEHRGIAWPAGPRRAENCMAQRPCLFGVWCCILTTYTPHHHQALCEVTMSKEAVFTMKLESELREQFMAEADAAHRPASQVVREQMREFVQRKRPARE